MIDKVFASCNCGRVQFSSNKQPVLRVCCHCSDCRNTTHNDFSTIAFFKVKYVTVAGVLSRQNYVADSHNNTCREFCANCGTVMFDRSEGFPHLVGVFEETLDILFVGQVDCHVWLQSKVPHISISSDAIQYTRGMGQ
jgi:hypothetical protein